MLSLPATPLPLFPPAHVCRWYPKPFHDIVHFVSSKHRAPGLSRMSIDSIPWLHWGLMQRAYSLLSRSCH